MTAPPRAHPRILLALLLCCLAPAAPAQAVESWIKNHPLHRIKSETLVYEVRSRLFVLPITLGTVAFTIQREGLQGEDNAAARQFVIQAKARGGAPGYPYKATITSRLRDSDLSQISADTRRDKPTYKTRLMRWQARGVDVLKHKHCEAPTLCHNPDHLVDAPSSSKVHCVDCEDPQHFVWSMRERHRGFYGRTHDLIAALYLARGLGVKPGGEAQVLRVISNRNMWDIYFSVEKEETVAVPAGQIPCYKLKLKFNPINRYSKKHGFEGPFGLHGDIGLYVDKQTRQVILVKGKVQLGRTFEVQVLLTERKVEYFDAAGPAAH